MGRGKGLRMKLKLGCLGVAIALGLLACGGQEPELGSRRTYGGPCLADGTCNQGLECVYHVCKEPGEDD